MAAADIKRGDIFYADLSPVVGSEQGGMRPVLIVQNNVGNHYSPTVIVAAITAKVQKAKMPTHVNINAAHTGIEKIRLCCWSRYERLISNGLKIASLIWMIRRCAELIMRYRLVLG
ncbi:toxin-antitoxin system, toxin component DNA-binding protein, PemK/MazF family [Lactiplantibacillus plantarum]|nr:hypothetical protein IYO1511_c04600 [Lactiplantibacillus plantarum]VDH09939.1 toxin-antitoxin system, toxin component DNA-binding protein, PemK/MazF family [Lactiplantibacillus plantarum]